MKMSDRAKPIRIVMAEDDADDRMLARDALEEARLLNEFNYVEDGQELLDYLQHRGKYAPPNDPERPHLILLDLNMPRMDGREALEKIKADPSLRGISIVILTTSKAEEDIVRSYDLGASGYITKPVTFDGLVNVMKGLKGYWFEIVELPREG